jgi:hypothetical protein
MLLWDWAASTPGKLKSLLDHGVIRTRDFWDTAWSNALPTELTNLKFYILEILLLDGALVPQTSIGFGSHFSPIVDRGCQIDSHKIEY